MPYMYIGVHMVTSLTAADAQECSRIFLCCVIRHAMRLCYFLVMTSL